MSAGQTPEQSWLLQGFIDCSVPSTRKYLQRWGCLNLALSNSFIIIYPALFIASIESSEDVTQLPLHVAAYILDKKVWRAMNDKNAINDSNTPNTVYRSLFLKDLPFKNAVRETDLPTTGMHPDVHNDQG